MNDLRPGIRPLGRRLIIWPIPTERVTESGIVLPEDAASREDMAQVEAIVVSIGEGCWSDQGTSRPWCEVGDKVIIAKYAGLERRGKDGKLYRLINDLDLVAAIDY